MNPTAPTVSPSQRLGQFGETLVAQQLVEHGFLFHPVSSGNDFGVDGRVECVAKEGVRAEEFFVQVKTSRRVQLSKDESRLRLRSVSVATAAYWHSKLTPTLLVVVCHASRRLWCEWAHEAVSGPTLMRAIRDGRRSVVPSVPVAKLVSSATWTSIGDEARREYLRIIGAVYTDRTRDGFLRLYRSVSDAYDLLTTFAVAAALEEPPPSDERRFPVEQVCTAIILFRALALASKVAEGDSLDETGQRLCSVTRAAADRVADLYMGIYANTDKEYQRGAEVALYGHPDVPDKLVALAAPFERVAEGIRGIALCTRDYLRILRIAVFPSIPDTDFPSPYMWLRDMGRKWLEPSPPTGTAPHVEEAGQQ